MTITETQGKEAVKTALADIMPLFDPGMGEMFQTHPLAGPVLQMKLPVARDEFMANASVAYPDDTAAFSTFLDAMEAYQQKVEALPEDVQATPYAHTIWMVYEQATIEGKAYLDAIKPLRDSATPLRHIFNLDEIEQQSE